nr:Hint domain-containing protein [Rhodovulum imhoffii]
MWINNDGQNSASASVVGPSWSSDLSFSVKLDATTQSDLGTTPSDTENGGHTFRVEIVVDGTVVASATETTDPTTNLLETYTLNLTATGNTPTNPTAPMRVRIVEDKADGDEITNNLNFDNVTLTVTDPNVTGAMNDVIDGGAGNDTIMGMGGNDSISGGADNDSIYGDAGNDTLVVGQGDRAFGGKDRDSFVLDITQAGLGDTFFIDGGTGTTSGNDTLDDYDVIDLNGLTKVANSFSASQDADGNSFTGTIQVTDGTDTWTVNFAEIEGVLCFTPGTHIETDMGLMPIEDLQVGDLVRTKDNGFQPIRWIGVQKLSAQTLAVNPKLRPVRIRADALAPGYPITDLVVSPQHRILVNSRIAARLSGTQEILVAAKQLVLLDGVDYAEDPSEVMYVHFLCERHEIVYAEGVETETLYTGPEALRTLRPEAREEIFTLFPALAELDHARLPDPARLMASGKVARKLAMRHRKNGKPLVC